MENEETEDLGTNEEDTDDIVEEESEASESEDELVKIATDVEDQNPNPEELEQFMIESQLVEDNVMDDIEVWIADLIQEEDSFGDLVVFSDFQDEFPMGANIMIPWTMELRFLSATMIWTLVMRFTFLMKMNLRSVLKMKWP